MHYTNWAIWVWVTYLNGQRGVTNYIITGKKKQKIQAARSDDQALAAHVRRTVALSEGAHVDVCMCTRLLDVV